LKPMGERNRKRRQEEEKGGEDPPNFSGQKVPA